MGKRLDALCRGKNCCTLAALWASFAIEARWSADSQNAISFWKLRSFG